MVAGLLIGGYSDGGAEGGSEDVLPQYIGHRAVSHQPSLSKHQQAGAEAGRQIHLMNNHEDCFAAAAQVTGEAVYLLLIENIQTGGRLVEEHHRRLLSQYLGQQHPLTLTARKLRGKMF